MASQTQRAEIPLGAAGLNGSKNQTGIPLAAFIDADNITYESGSIRKEGGATKINSVAIAGAPSIIGGWDFHPTATAQHDIIVASNGSIYLDNDGDGDFADGTAGGSVMVSGLTVSSVRPFFVEGGKEAAANNHKLFIFTEKNAVQVVDGTATVTAGISAGATDWSGANQPIGGFVHQSRNWGYGNANQPHLLYASLITDHEDFTTTPFSLPVYPGEGEGILLAISFKKFIVIFKKPGGVYLGDTRDANDANWTVERINSHIAIASNHAAVVIENDVLFMDRSGNYHLVSQLTDEAFGTNNLSRQDEMGEFLRNELNLGQAANVRAIYYAAKEEAQFATAGSGSATNTRRVVVDFSGQKPRFRVSRRDVAESLWLRQDSDGVPRPAMGDASGFVWNLDVAARSKDSAAYEAVFQTPHSDFSELEPLLATRRKNWAGIELVFEPKGDHDLFVDTFLDGNFGETIAFNMGGAGFLLDTDVLDTGALALVGVQTIRHRMTGSSRRLSLKFRNSGVGEDFSVQRCFTHMNLGSERV